MSRLSAGRTPISGDAQPARRTRVQAPGGSGVIHTYGSQKDDGGAVVKAEQRAGEAESSITTVGGPLSVMVTAADPLTGELLAGRLTDGEITAEQVGFDQMSDRSRRGAFDAMVAVPPGSLLEYVEHGWHDALATVDPAIALVVLSNPRVPVRALTDGRRGHSGLALLDRTTSTTLQSVPAAIRFSLAGRHTIDPVFTEFGDPMITSLFSPAERAVFEQLANGCSNRAIAERLYLSERTVETHVRQIFMRLGLTDDGSTNRRVVAARLALDGTANVLSSPSR